MIAVGYKAPAEQCSPRELLELAVLAEESGIDSVAIADARQRALGGATWAASPMPWLRAVGERTTSIRLGTSVITPALRYDPVAVAETFGELVRRHPGRVFLGVGAGSSRSDVMPAGMDWPPAHERLTRLCESVELVQLLGEGVPIHMAVAGPRSARAAGRLADGIICRSGWPDDAYLEVIAGLYRGARLRGRDVAAIERTIEIDLAADSGESPDEVAERVGRYVGLGFTHLIFRSRGSDPQRFLLSLAHDVAPVLRDRFGQPSMIETGVC